MANAFISGRRYPTGGGGEVIPAGSQSFTSNGTFTAPYTGVYTVAITAPIAKGGDGANGVNGYVSDRYYGTEYPTGGGAGGSAYIAVYPLIISVWLTQGQQVPITVNTSVASFGSYGSFTAGTAGGNGTSGTRDSSPKHGTGGAGGSMPMTATSGTLTAIMPPIPSASLSGGGGSTNSGSVSGDPSASYDGATGGRPSTAFGNAGGCGGEGSAVLVASYMGYASQSDVVNTSVSRRNGQPAKAGRIDITWGNSNE